MTDDGTPNKEICPVCENKLECDLPKHIRSGECET
jgi:hypothetical protein